MGEDLTFEVPAYNTSHRMFITPELMSKAYPRKRDKHEFKKAALRVVTPNMGGMVPLEKQPRNHAARPDGPSKSNRQKYARRARRRAEKTAN